MFKLFKDPFREKFGFKLRKKNMGSMFLDTVWYVLSVENGNIKAELMGSGDISLWDIKKISEIIESNELFVISTKRSENKWPGIDSVLEDLQILIEKGAIYQLANEMIMRGSTDYVFNFDESGIVTDLENSRAITVINLTKVEIRDKIMGLRNK